MNPTEAKRLRRAEVRALLQGLATLERAEQARQLTARILATPEWQAARRILLFVPLPDEIDLGALIPAGLKAGKRIGLPAFDGGTGVYLVREILDPTTDLILGRFNIREPGPQCRTMSVAELDLLLVPGLAFDATGGRLGRGRGFYDRLLVPATGTLWGVGFREQVGPLVPREPHDRCLDAVYTAVGSESR